MIIRKRRRRLHLEQLESRDLLTTISGLVFQTVDVVDSSILTIQPPGPGVGNVTVIATGTNPANKFTTTTTASGSNLGQYQFGSLEHPLPADTYQVSVQLPSGFWGFTAQSFQASVALADKEDFGNLNFAIMPISQASAQNLYQRVLVRSTDPAGLNFWATGLGNGSISAGQALTGFISSSEFLTLDAPLAGMLAALYQNQQLPLDTDLFRHNEQLIRNGVTADAAVLNTIYTQSFITVFGDTSQLSNQQFVTFVYNQLLHRMPDPGANFWINQLNGSVLNRGQLLLAFLGQPEFQTANPAVADEVSVSMAYLGLLGRAADPGGYQFWLSALENGTTITQMGNEFAGSPEFEALQGYTDPLIADAASAPIQPTIPVLNRLQQYDPASQSFDTAVTSQSVLGQTGASNPVDLYVWVHGWAPGYEEDELLNSTPGDPLTVWGTVQHPGGSPPVPASASLFNGVDQVSVEGMAQSIIDSDPNAVVLAYSWLDSAATGGAGINSLLGGAQSESNAQQDGLRLAEAMEAALAPSFFSAGGLIHLMGHSHGSKVATVATLRMQQDGFPVAQLTTLESPEDGPTGFTVIDDSKTITLKDQHLPGLIAAQNFDWYFMQQLNSNANNNVVGGTGGRTPIAPTGSQIAGQNPTYIDNYYSTDGVGMPFGGIAPLTSVFSNAQSLSNIADVDLNPQVLYPPPTSFTTAAEIAQFFATVGGSHNYPPPWYTQAQIPPAVGNDNGLAWSPLLNATPSSGSPGLYTQQDWPANDLSQQFTLSAPAAQTALTPFSNPFEYATNYNVGTVTDNGSGTITLGRGQGLLSMDAVTFTPLTNTSFSGHPNGTGLSLQFQFQNAQPGDELIVWTRGLFNLTVNAPNNPQSSGLLGYQTVPLLVMTGTDAGTKPQYAAVGLDLLGNQAGLITGNGNLADGLLGLTQQPVLGFSLLHVGNSQSTVTITNMQQFSDGT